MTLVAASKSSGAVRPPPRFPLLPARIGAAGRRRTTRPALASTTTNDQCTKPSGSPVIDPQHSENRDEQIQRSLYRACRCAQVADEYRGRDVIVLDLTRVTPIVDYFVVVTGTSRRQMHAIAEEVDRAMAEIGSDRIGIEGYDASHWILQDYGDVVLHVFAEDTRETYDLEHLWADAPRIDWQQTLAQAAHDS